MTFHNSKNYYNCSHMPGKKIYRAWHGIQEGNLIYILDFIVTSDKDKGTKQKNSF